MVVAPSLIASAEAPKAVLSRHDESSATDAALRQTREQVQWALRGTDGARGLHRVPGVFLACLRSRPDLVRHDPQPRNVLRHPLRCRIEPRHTLSSVGILHVTKPIPDEPADVKLVVQNSGSALVVPVNRARTPGAAERARDAFTIQVLRNLLRRNSRDEVPEYPLDDSCLSGYDFAFAGSDGSGVQCLDDAIAVAEPAGGFTILDATAQPAMCLLGEILEEQGVHRALEAYVQVRDVAFGQSDDVDAGKGEALEEPGGVFLVAAEAVQRLGEDHVESTVQRIAHQRLETRSKQRGAGHRVVGVLLRDRPALSLGKSPANAHLIGDGRVTLVVRRVARVDGDFHARVPQ